MFHGEYNNIFDFLARMQQAFLGHGFGHRRTVLHAVLSFAIHNM